MPTAPKLIAAFLFAGLAWLVAAMAHRYFPEGTPWLLVPPSAAFFGLLMGWGILGKSSGSGIRTTAGYAITAAVATTFWVILLWSGYRMTMNSIRMRYDGPIDALYDMATIALEFGQAIAVYPIIFVFLSGTIIAAACVEFAARRWK